MISNVMSIQDKHGNLLFTLKVKQSNIVDAQQ